ncbi:MAG: GHKL domain-containing protein [Sphingomonadales bacterium]|nr:MAG: GHKL domain-containing protein [Sphingomonadales bacterium]
MSQDQLGLFDTEPAREEIRLGLVLAGLLFVALVILSALPHIRLRQIDPFIPMVDAIMFFGDLMTAALLYVQAAVFRSRALSLLASGYVLTGLLLIAHALTFPGAFAPDGLLGARLNTTAWISVAWRATPLVAIILYAVLKRKDSKAPSSAERPSAGLTVGLSTAIVLAGAVVLLATRGHDLLPSLFINRSTADHANVMAVNWMMVALSALALAVLFPNRRSVLDMWLLVALAGWLAHALLTVQGSDRFTLSFYSQFSLLVFAHFVVMIALFAENSRLFTRLAMATAARKRERDSRLLSMDAMAAAISHEVGQPLTSVISSTMAGLNSLTRSTPDVEKAIMAQRATLDAGHRTFDVIKSIRAMFAQAPGRESVFNLNDLIRETAALLDRELTGEKVSLEFALDEALPPVRADRVQMQQVLVNILTNAIEALGQTPRRGRRITIRSRSLDSEGMLLEISDTGPGIEADNIERIFEAFVTTKKTGTGLGLSLCRTIIEEHGGRLWASPGEKHGATFHLQLPRSNLVALSA